MDAAPNFRFAGEAFCLLERALYWPRHRALIVADLHLEKASWFAERGQLLPPYDSHDTLERLGALAASTKASQIWCLGDSFHDTAAASRITPVVAERLGSLTRSTRLVWIAGNHDGLSGGAWGGEVADELEVDGIVLRHQCSHHERRGEISGHFHPKLRVSYRGRTLRRPCFAADAQRLILPAFGSLTGGLDVEDPAIAVNFGGGSYDAMVVANARLLQFRYPGRKPMTLRQTGR